MSTSWFMRTTLLIVLSVGVFFAGNAIVDNLNWMSLTNHGAKTTGQILDVKFGQRDNRAIKYKYEVGGSTFERIDGGIETLDSQDIGSHITVTYLQNDPSIATLNLAHLRDGVFAGLAVSLLCFVMAAIIFFAGLRPLLKRNLTGVG